MEKYEVYNLIINAFGTIATLIAVIIALQNSIFIKRKLSLSISIKLLKDEVKSKSSPYVHLLIYNTRNHVIEVGSYDLKIYDYLEKKYKYRHLFADITLPNDNLPTPMDINPQRSVSLLFERDKFYNNFIKRSLKDNDKLVISIGLTNGKIYNAKSKKTIKELFSNS